MRNTSRELRRLLRIQKVKRRKKFLQFNLRLYISRFNIPKRIISANFIETGSDSRYTRCDIWHRDKNWNSTFAKAASRISHFPQVLGDAVVFLNASWPSRNHWGGSHKWNTFYKTSFRLRLLFYFDIDRYGYPG